MGKDFRNCKVLSLCVRITPYHEVQGHIYYFKKSKYMVYNWLFYIT